MTTDNTPATLATAKHGGCVQLSTSERERFEAWAKHRVSSMARAADGEYVSSFTHALWCAWQAALPAQPSPGGQGDALGKCNECGRRTFHNYPQGDICLHCNLTAGEGRSTESVALDALVAAGHVDQVTADQALKVAAALAARQPVGEPVCADCTTPLLYECPGCSKMNYPEPAQAMDLGAVRNAVQGITLGFDGDLPYIKGIAEALALIDSQAVGNG